MAPSLPYLIDSVQEAETESKWASNYNDCDPAQRFFGVEHSLAVQSSKRLD
jgi:hypothetical protein